MPSPVADALRASARARRVLVLVSVVVPLLGQVPARAQEPDLVRPVRGAILRRFEPPPTPYAAGHRGIDVAAPPGTTVVAAAAGVVTFAGAIGGERYVSIDHADGLRTTYSYVEELLVRRGEPVAQGAPVARAGPCHGEGPDGCLHFGVRRGEEYLDPERLLLASIRRNLWRVIRLTA